MDWEAFEQLCLRCRECPLGENRKNVVIGQGQHNAPLMLIGEAPGEEEDSLGLSFVGPGGQLLDTLLKALKIEEDKVYRTHVVKCRPPGNRMPFEEEAHVCLNHLKYQVAQIKPKIIVCMGTIALRHIVDENAILSESRGSWIEKKGFEILVTFQATDILRDASKKILMWQDFKKVEKRFREIC